MTDRNHSVEKTLKIIEALAQASTPLRLSELSKMVSMPASTVLRMAKTLVSMGYAYQEEEEPCRYGLTMRFLKIGQMAAAHFSIRDIAHPYLGQISQVTGESCCLAIEDHHKVRYIDVIEGRGNMITIRQQVGHSGKMHCTGSGKLFLMQYTEEELDRYIEDAGLLSLTPHTITTKKDLQYELKECQERGYAIDDEECEIGMRCIAVPVYDVMDRVCAAISISGPISRMSKLLYETEFAPLLCSMADKVTKKITGACDDTDDEA